MNTNKIDLIKAEVERLKGWNNNVRNSTRHMTLQEEDFNRGKHSSYIEILNFIDSLQEEPVKDRLIFKAIPRLLDMVEPTDRAKAYIAKLADTLEVEGYSTDAKIVRESLKIMNGEKVPMATMDEEPVSEELGEYINELSKQFPEVSFAKLSRIAVRVAKWQKEHLWKPADGDDLPIIDREVIALLDNGKVVFAHRPPEFWDGKDIITGKVTRNYPKTYGKGGWNIPNVVYWLDCYLPKEIEL